MRVAQLFPHSVREITGIGTIVQEISRAVAGQGDSSLWIVAGGSGGKLLEEPEHTFIAEIPTHTMPAYRNVFLAIGALWILLRANPRITHVHAHAPHLQALSGILAAKILGIPSIVTFHGILPSPEEILRKILFRWTHKMVLRYASAITTVSTATLSALGPGKGLVIPNGVPAHSFPASMRRELRSDWGIEDSIAFTYAGRLAASKGILLLIDVFASLVTRHPANMYLILVGGGSRSEAMQIQTMLIELNLRERVILLPPSQKYAEYLSAADIFVIPSFHEGLPITLLEAMSVGLPCIATAVGGIPEVVRNGTDGLLVAPGDKDALLRAMEELVRSPSRRQTLGGSAQARVHSLFSLDTMIGKYLDLYAKLDFRTRDHRVRALDRQSGPN